MIKSVCNTLFFCVGKTFGFSTTFNEVLPRHSSPLRWASLLSDSSNNKVADQALRTYSAYAIAGDVAQLLKSTRSPLKSLARAAAKPEGNARASVFTTVYIIIGHPIFI